MPVVFQSREAMLLFRFLPDAYTQLLIGVVLLATLLPASGPGATAFAWLTRLAIALLFFLHGARLSRQAILAGATHWRLHLLIFACTFALFPLLGLALKPLLLPLLGEELYLGMLFLCTLPATVQSAIAFTSLAGGNVAAAICSAAGSSLLGIFLTPLLVLWLMGAQGAGVSALEAIGAIVVQLLVPFLAGQLARPLIGDWLVRNGNWLRRLDQGSILLVIYTAFSAAVVAGLWEAIPPLRLVLLTLVCTLFLALVLGLVEFLGRRVGLAREDRITLLFGGSKKSMATGIPMAQVLFVGGAVGPLILPLMIFHQIQLMVCAALAQRMARPAADPAPADEPVG
jgi:sodium/bile acid cotransporter 7